MKALTIYAPWSSLIIEGLKPFEYRRWDFSRKPALRALIGERIVIHASVRPMRASELAELKQRMIDEPELTGLKICGATFDLLDRAWRNPGRFPLGAALGTVVLGQPKPVAEIHGGTCNSDRLDHQMFGWPVSDPIRFEPPRPMRGFQGFWQAPEGAP